MSALFYILLLMLFVWFLLKSQLTIFQSYTMYVMAHRCAGGLTKVWTTVRLHHHKQLEGFFYMANQSQILVQDFFFPKDHSLCHAVRFKLTTSKGSLGHKPRPPKNSQIHCAIEVTCYLWHCGTLLLVPEWKCMFFSILHHNIRKTYLPPLFVFQVLNLSFELVIFLPIPAGIKYHWFPFF